MTITEATQLLEQFRAGRVSQEKVLQAFQTAPSADLGFATVDTHRALRKGFPEVIFGAGKTPEQVAKIAGKLLEHGQNVLATRVTPEHARVVQKKFKKAVYHELARCLTIETKPLPKRSGGIAVVCAGTSDLAVAEEAAVTAEIMGNTVTRINDVGVAGVHRLLSRLDTIHRANVVVVVAG
ncbi:MAG TPA: 1-(5-phosphoribosyl)-5-amino-4-imidazole-carboxylate carboxylase, partial [Candidatus Paceibacterota bacterium]|nr:1-(5-phosphoribosyl)-5-amino-4-imidazole-carboxylate carboxylase [Candidatus Paceibacterota bacterium]